MIELKEVSCSFSDGFGEKGLFTAVEGDGSFNVYDDIRTKLLAAGVPESEVEFIPKENNSYKGRRDRP